MQINYLEDLHIPSLGDWSPEATGDWLHPLHGPVPDHLGLLECEGREFMAALWERSNTLVVMLEQLEIEDTDPRVPLRHIDDVYNMRGWIAQTYLWSISMSGITYGPYSVIPEKYEDRPEWRRNIYRAVLIESIKVCVDLPGGFYGP
jgi:hypothetical protein